MAALALTVLAPLSGCSKPTSSTLPALQLRAVDGTTTLELGQLGATGPVVINLWATWCVPCRAELPLLQTASGRWHDRVAFIGINLGDRDQAVTAFLADLRITFGQYLDPASSMSEALGVTGLPMTILVGPGAAVLQTLRGAVTVDQLDGAIRQSFDLTP